MLEGQEFKTPLPAHCTLMPALMLVGRQNIGELIEVVGNRTRSEEWPRLEIIPSEKVLFGPKLNVPVTQVVEHYLRKAHNILLIALPGVEHEREDWVFKGYKPHVSDINDWTFLDKEPIVATELVILEIFELPTGKVKRVRVVIPLKR